MNEQGKVVAVCVSASGGIPRYATSVVELTPQGVVGDKHRYIEHETNERAVSLFDAEMYERLLIDGQSPPPGSVGENVTVCGLGLANLPEGTEIALGDAVVRLTRPWAPCYAQHPESGKTQPNDEKLSGWFAMVTRAARVAVGDVANVS
ncbi:MOSC domain-containing protein [Blastopirellula retiformator]|uniref:MOSC domain protein n=1 Tax=Blastopirellula retiformator TaxID=2527970 RepID=A0A5C5UUD0_9BACT|nr:MOSC domain-containing protein [Blastopirellula retiformator]TWT29981.1 MOSC domain protein [Blastopirellula retiformator]